MRITLLVQEREPAIIFACQKMYGKQDYKEYLQ